jgi:NCS1 family nucleobase:cation symporter-1
VQREGFRDFGFDDPAELSRIKAEVSSSSLYNEDLAPTGPDERTWTTYNIAALWIGMPSSSLPTSWPPPLWPPE